MKCQVIFLLLSAIVGCKASSVPCEVPCTKEMVPVCGTDGDNFVVFSNACLMNNQKCKDGKSWTKSDLRSCGLYDSRDEVKDDCQGGCPALVLPVCGYNGDNFKLFVNACMMENSHCAFPKEKAYTSVPLSMCQTSTGSIQSRSSDLPECPLACTEIYTPTCGYDGNEYKVFGNKCALQAYNCLRTESWQTVSLELCPKEAQL
ncbi:unnamed protein product [Hermetia illucens]|uniref:Kazal-like domain-containing protein n=1 Tax=Hermetia illucens TaxID=343691 RepID=A0A7R8YT48_HERIL|nr:enhancer of split M1 protein [Hermetia illucens]CAD7084592.1 unnamed protein product [Hermetia illucens]